MARAVWTNTRRSTWNERRSRVFPRTDARCGSIFECLSKLRWPSSTRPPMPSLNELCSRLAHVRVPTCRISFATEPNEFSAGGQSRIDRSFAIGAR